MLHLLVTLPGLQIRITLMRIWIPQSFHFSAELDTSHLNADLDPIFTLLRIRIQRLIKCMRICNQWATDHPRLHFEPSLIRPL